MNRTEKQTFVEDLNKTFKASTSVLLINFEGVDVLAQSELRREISKVDSSYQVIKNRLALRAVEDTSLEALREHFQGPTAIAYTGGDPVALAKVLNDFIRDHPSVAFKAGVVEGKTFSASDVERLAKMLGRLLFLRLRSRFLLLCLLFCLPAVCCLLSVVCRTVVC